MILRVDLCCNRCYFKPSTKEPSKPPDWLAPLFCNKEDAMAPLSQANANGSKGTTLLAGDREGLIRTLTEYPRRLDDLISYLEGLEQEARSLRSASESIKSVIERLSSLEEPVRARAATAIGNA